MQHKYLLLLVFLIFCLTANTSAQQVEKKVVLQGFWWGYENQNYPNGWANYIADLAPRLREMGIDAVWVPPFYKNNSTFSTGYAPFDHYDLGDKYQKGYDGEFLNVRTRVGTKDEVLRMIAVLHANGIEVIEDITINHLTGAGNGTSDAGGLDPEPTYSMATNAGFKNFRYVCYATPRVNSTLCDYGNREGRWPKNYTNFHPNPQHNVSSGDWESGFWGPDFSYGINEAGDGMGYGPSSNICSYPSCPGVCFDPEQPPTYTRDQARNCFMWFKKQTGVDGYRWDAVKHFPYFVQQDLSYNAKYLLPEWANGGASMFNVGEYVGSKNELDTHVDNVAYSNGGSEMLMGTFDFGLRAFDPAGGVEGMVSGAGFFDMSTLPAAQQERRYSDIDNMRVHRTVPFVNNHDTFRPQFDGQGNYMGWDTANELSPHIDPYNDRLALAYAVVMAVDGNPQVFMEDLFDIGMNGNRFSHDPTSTSQLPARSPIINLIWCHQNLDFKSGDYKVRSTAAGGNVYFNEGSSAQDLLVVERGGKALIGMNDRGDTWQSAYVDSDFAPGTILKDYSGANGNTTYTVPADGRVNVNTPPVNPAEGQYGYSVWAPVDAAPITYQPSRSPITSQEWELADDLGDSHCLSLGQGGMIPSESCAYRIAGKIYPETGSAVTITVYKSEEVSDLTVSVYDAAGNIIAREEGTAQPLVATFNAPSSDWYSIKVRSTNGTAPAQVAYVRADYTAPTEINAANTFAVPTAAMWNGNAQNCDWNDCSNWDEGFIPDNNTVAIIPECVTNYPCIPSDFPPENLDDRSELVLPTQETISLQGIRISPNPFGESLHLNCPTCTGIYNLEMLDVTGKVLISRTASPFGELEELLNDNIHHLPKGLYFLRISNEQEGVWLERIIKGQ